MSCSFSLSLSLSLSFSFSLSFSLFLSFFISFGLSHILSFFQNMIKFRTPMFLLLLLFLFLLLLLLLKTHLLLHFWPDLLMSFKCHFCICRTEAYAEFQSLLDTQKEVSFYFFPPTAMQKGAYARGGFRVPNQCVF